MSETIICQDTHLDRKVLVKSLKHSIDQGKLVAEVSAILGVRSKHVVQIFDLIRSAKGEVLAFVEEYADGDDLLTMSPAPTQAGFLKTAYQIAAGIADLHARNIVHRDIKPQNMKFDSEGCLKIFDFGLAKIGEDLETTEVFATKGYAAPELYSAVMGKKTAYTKEVDVYAFGATLLRIQTGKLPVELLTIPPAPLAPANGFSQLSSMLPPSLIELFDSCLSTKASDRPSIAKVKAEIGANLLKSKHRALIMTGGKTYELNSSKAIVKLSVAGQGALSITYDGYVFRVGDVFGAVIINNIAGYDGQILPSSCVIVLGNPDGGRTNITFDVSHPEVTI